MVIRRGMVEPIILGGSELAGFRRKNKVWRVVDVYEKQLGELFEINHPRLLYSADLSEKKRECVKQRLKKEKGRGGSWVYYPWSGVLVHMVSEKEYFELRTNRNRNLITKDEQRLLAGACVGVVGMSIGAAMVKGLVAQGIGGELRLAEFDDLETTNLNRVWAGVEQVGKPKIEIVMEQIFEMNPYQVLKQFGSGLDEKSLGDFLAGKKKPAVVFEAIDDLRMKIKLRMAARKARVPVVMFTNLEDRVLVDVERFDLKPYLSLFNGRIGKVPEEILGAEIGPAEVNEYVLELVGVDNIPKRAVESVREVGKTLVGRPQLASTVTISGGMAAMVARKIILGQRVKSGRKLVKFGEVF